MSEFDELNDKIDANQNMNSGEHDRLWQGIDTANTMRIAGDNANIEALSGVRTKADQNSEHLSNEIVDRANGDLYNQNKHSELRMELVSKFVGVAEEFVDTNKNIEATAEELKTDINKTNATVKEVDDRLGNGLVSLNQQTFTALNRLEDRVRNYETLLQDITMDSTQITMDNGEINLGAWTILSQAREWDLAIIADFKKLKQTNQEQIDKGLEDVTNAIPNTQDIINKTMEQLSTAPIIIELDRELGLVTDEVTALGKSVLEQRKEFQDALVDVADNLSKQVQKDLDTTADKLNTTSKELNDSIAHETTIRLKQVELLEDGLTTEETARIEGDSKAYEMIENIKATSEGSLANFREELDVQASKIEANTNLVTQMDAKVSVLDANTNTALANSATALDKANASADQSKAVAEDMVAVKASLKEVSDGLEDKADVIAFNNLKTEVERVDGVTKANSANIVSLTGDVSSMQSDIAGHTNAINSLTIEQNQMGDSLSQIAQDTSLLGSKITTIEGQVITNSSLIATNTAKTEKNERDITSLTSSSIALEAKLDGISVGANNLLARSDVWLGGNLAYAEGLNATYSSGLDVLFVWASAGNNGWLTNFLGYDQIKDIDSICNENDDVIFSVDVLIEPGSTVMGPMLYWKADMNYERLVLAKGQELRYNEWYRFYHTRKYKKGGHGFHFNFGGMTGTYRFRRPVVEKGTIPTAWQTADVDKASAVALNDLRAETLLIDGKVTTMASELTTLKATVDANQANLTNNFYTKAEVDQVNAGVVTNINAKLSKMGRNYVRNTAVERKGKDWLFEDKLTARLTGQITISFDFVELTGSPIGGGVGFNHGNEANGGYNYVWYPEPLNTGRHTWTGVVDSGDFTHFGVFSNTQGIVKNVKVEYGDVATQWSTAPEDIEIGARNILRNSAFNLGDGGWYWTGYLANISYHTGELINGKPAKWAYIRDGGTDGGLYMRPSEVTVTAKRGDMMTISFWARGNGTILYGFDDANDTAEVVPTEWRYISKTFRRLRSDNVIFYRKGATYLDVAFPKVELGTKATEWTPAPEDVIEVVDGLSTATNTLTAQVSEIDGKLTTNASQILTLTAKQTSIEAGQIPGNDEVVIDLRDASYNRDLYYPVALSPFSTVLRQTIRVMSTLDGVAVPPWATHNGGYSLNAQFQMGGAGWGTVNPEVVTDNFQYSFTQDSLAPLDEVGQLWHSSQPFFYVRGGGFYRLSKPIPRSIAVCAPGGYLSNDSGQTLYPRPYQSTSVPKSINASLDQQTVKLQQTNEVVDGVKAVSTVSVDNNGWISGYGLISQLINGVVVSAFGVNADYFYVGNGPSTAKKPFMVLTTPQTIGGVSYPAGTWMDVAVIANATIGTAHIADASITNAKIVNLDAAKITTGYLSSDRIEANTISAEKLVIGDTTNLWVNPYFSQNGPKLESSSGRTQWNGGITELKSKMGVQLWGRDHIAPYSTRIPLKAGESFVIEFTCGLNAGPNRALGVGLWIYDVNGSVGASPFQYGSADWIADLGGGWHRFRRTFQVWDNGSGLPAAFGCLYFLIEQSDYEANPSFWTIGDVIVRRQMGGELIVNGAITANKLYSDTVSGMFANFGSFTTVGNGGSTTISGPATIVKDTAGTERIFIGIR